MSLSAVSEYVLSTVINSSVFINMISCKHSIKIEDLCLFQIPETNLTSSYMINLSRITIQRIFCHQMIFLEYMNIHRKYTIGRIVKSIT